MLLFLIPQHSPIDAQLTCGTGCFQVVSSNVPGAAGPPSAASALSWSGWCRSEPRWDRWVSPRAPSWPQWHHPPGPAGPQQVFLMPGLDSTMPTLISEHMLHSPPPPSTSWSHWGIATNRARGKLACLAGVMLSDVEPTLRGSEMPGVMGAPLSIRNLIHSLIKPALNLLVKGPA